MPDPQPHIKMDDPRVLALARWRQQISHEGVYNPTWDELTDEEREGALPDARNYLKAAIRAGLVPVADSPAPPTTEPSSVPTAADVEALHAFLYARADEEHAAAMDDPTMDGAALERFSRVSNSNKYGITATAELLVDLLDRGDDEKVARAWHCMTGAGEQWREHPDYLSRWENPQLARVRQLLGG